MSDEVLLCKDCKHSFRKWGDWFVPEKYSLKCRLAYREEKVEVDPVIGKQITPAHYENCNTSRLDYLSKHNDEEGCGKQGRFWQPKHKKDLFKLIKKESV